jgi:hypothetical protein
MVKSLMDRELEIAGGHVRLRRRPLGEYSGSLL